MNPNLEKILKMLEMEAVKVRESNDFAQLDSLKLEIERFIKTEYAKILELREQLILDALNGEEEGEIGTYKVTYKGGQRFALDTKKLRDEFQELTDEEFKNRFYSHSETKPTIKLKNK